MSQGEIGTILRTSWDGVWRAVEPAVEWGPAHRDPSGVTAIGLDEVARQRKHTDMTPMYDIRGATKRPLAVAEPRGRAEG